jgi:hypothetical protein
MKRALSLLALIGLTGCTTTLSEREYNKLTRKQQKEVAFNTGMQTYMQRDTNAVPQLTKELLPTDLAFYTEFPRVACTVHYLPPGNTTNDTYWEGKIDTTAPFINQSIPTLEKLRALFTKKGTLTQLTFPDEKGIISKASGLECVQYHTSTTNTGLGITFKRTTKVQDEQDTSSWTYTITTGLPHSRIQGKDRNYLAFRNTLETTGMGMAIVPFAGGIVGAGQALSEASFYWDTRNPRIAHTKVETHTDLPYDHARVRVVAETARATGANKVYIMETTEGMLFVYGKDTKHPLTGPNKEHNLAPNTFYASGHSSGRKHLEAFFFRALQAGSTVGLTYAFPLTPHTQENKATGSSGGMSGGSSGAPGGR